MSYDKVIDSAKLDAAMAATANAIRSKTGDSASIEWAQETGFADAVSGIQTGGGGGATVAEKEVNFFDYDGTLVHSYTVAEAQALTELPPGPEHKGLIFQKWNWSLEDVKALTHKMDIGALYTTDDGATRLYIHLEEGRTSPMLGVCPNGTVTVDWGDGTTPDTLTGTSISTVKWTPNHEYAAPGDYVIRLTVDGEMGLSGSPSSNRYSYVLRYASSADNRNAVYQNAVQKIEIGNNVTALGGAAFYGCRSLVYLAIPDSITSIGGSAFYSCFSLVSLVVPDGVTSIPKNIFSDCHSLIHLAIPNGVTSIGDSAFSSCYSLSSLVIPDSVTSMGTYMCSSCYSLLSFVIPDGVTSIGNNSFQNCYVLNSLKISDSVTSIGNSAFSNCYVLNSLKIPDSVTSIGSSVFYFCYSLSSVVISNSVTSIKSFAFNDCRSLVSLVVPDSVTSIESSAFQGCHGARYYDFSGHAIVPTLPNVSAFNSMPADCEIRVPAALYDEWIAATNWSTYASQIVAV